MLRRLIPSVFVVGVIMASAAPAKAQWVSGWWHEFTAGFKRNNMWPEPFIYPDREAVCLPLSQMAMKGWHKQNLLGSYHFDSGTGALNAAGEAKVRNILTMSAPDRRAIFVERGNNGEVTSNRIDQVQQFAVSILPSGELPEVTDTNMSADGTPADEVDALIRAVDKNRPAPILPAPIAENGGQ